MQTTHTPALDAAIEADDLARCELEDLKRERDSLLAACELCVATLERVEPAHTHGPFSSIRGTLDVARAAITKARGEKGEDK